MTRTAAMIVAVLASSTACIGKRSSEQQVATKKAPVAKQDPAPAGVEPPAKAERVPEPAVQQPLDPANTRARFQPTRPEAASLLTGDLVFVQGGSRHASALGAAMPGELNHVGLVFVTSDGPQVVSAGKKLDQASYDQWLRHNSASHIVVKRLKDAEALLTDEKLLPLKQFSFTSRGRDYDYSFDWDDTNLYASEYVHKAFVKGPGVELGKKETLASLGLDAATAKAIGDKYGGTVDVNTEVVTVASIFADERLSTVFDSAAKD
ncbi:MAG: YiiX/YebB-like N1pC/P60 family cysteine hydrolase [Myxococcota bacterium]